jgi:hypothetical protein
VLNDKGKNFIYLDSSWRLFIKISPETIRLTIKRNAIPKAQLRHGGGMGGGVAGSSRPQKATWHSC